MSAVPLQLSSGDPALDRRVEWARALMEEGNAADAADMLAEVTRRAPDYPAGWFLFAKALEAAGDGDGALGAYGCALALDEQDRLGAGLRLARLGQAPADGMSAAYVRTLFDQYADRFDDALGRLGYSGPAVVRAALEAACERLGCPFAFARGHDLGCGTGLVGGVLADHVGRLSGVDLSPNMIALARARGIYDQLEAGEMLAFLAARPPGEADLIVAGDAFCYLGDLGSILGGSARVLEPGGLLAFTVESHDGAGILLRDTLRYAHSRDYVQAAVARAGLSLLSCVPVSTRTEQGLPVPGLVVVAMRE